MFDITDVEEAGQILDKYLSAENNNTRMATIQAMHEYALVYVDKYYRHKPTEEVEEVVTKGIDLNW